MLHRCKTTFFRYSYIPVLPVLLVPARCQANIPSRSHVVDAKVIESLTYFNAMSFCRSKEVTKNISVQNASEWNTTRFYLRVLVEKYVFHAIV